VRGVLKEQPRQRPPSRTRQLYFAEIPHQESGEVSQALLSSSSDSCCGRYTEYLHRVREGVSGGLQRGCSSRTPRISISRIDHLPSSLASRILGSQAQNVHHSAHLVQIVAGIEIHRPKNCFHGRSSRFRCGSTNLRWIGVDILCDTNNVASLSEVVVRNDLLDRDIDSS
jgi:hypothetical protein